MSDKKDLVRKQLYFTPRLNEMVLEIQDDKGYPSFSAVVHQSIIDHHHRCFPAYTNRDKSAEVTVQRKQDKRDALEKLEREKLASICTVLGGKIKDENGTDYCIYHTYAHKKRYEQKVPVDQLTEDLSKNQYSPSKTKVESLQKAGKVDYKI